MYEIVINLHMHTKYSDGHANHAEIAQAAIRAGLDAVIVTDHNVLVNGPEDYYINGDQRVLLLVGEEIHDQTRQPQKNHLLVLGTKRELAPFAPDPQHLINMVHKEGGLSFIAHPVDPASPAFNEPDISWIDWNIQGFNGIELWNAMSEFKSLLTSKLRGIYYALNPKRVARGPFPETLQKWDELLATGKRIVAIGGSDAHAFPASFGPLQRTVFPYEFHFQSVNTHLYIQRPLNGDIDSDRGQILNALSRGCAFIGYDLPFSTRGFRFYAHGMDRTAWMGETISSRRGITFQICLPFATECQLLKDGEIVKTWHKHKNSAYITSEPGVYRVEARIHYQGQSRGWIYSNPIYVE